KSLQSCFIVVLLNLQANLAAALKRAQYHRLIATIPTADTSAMTADICLVAFNRASQWLWVLFSHRLTNAVAEIPCRLIRHFQQALKLERAHALARLSNQEDCEEPLRQRQMRVMEESSGCSRKLVAALITLKDLARLDSADAFRLAAWT